MSLMLHCGAEPVTRLDLHSATVPPATGTYAPVNYLDFLSEIEASVHRHGYAILGEQFGMRPDGSQMFGLFRLECPVTDGVSLSLGFRSSLNKTLRPEVAAADNVFVCDNLCLSGIIVSGHKQTPHCGEQLPARIDEAVSRLGDYATGRAEQIEALRGMELDSTQVHDILCQAAQQTGKDEIVSWSQAGKVHREWDSPRHPEFRPRTAWSLMNAFTEVMKSYFQRNAPEAATRTLSLNSLFRDLVERN